MRGINILNLFFKYCKLNIIKNNYKDELLNAHPKQIVNKIDNIPLMIYKVNYSYTTVRGNKKEGVKYFIYNTFNPQINMEEELNSYIKEFNKENPNRNLLNVKFLNSQCLGYMTL
ncbi:MAG: hypothetical protein KHZ90_08540 [Veillonella parvula]|uniref:Uncharacterized protein n=1 Tax=Veillonella parvula TaxID=29466 RepID=A0A942WVP5_VEIPA|nr:hypothetical protein [Veillonella parvula]MBS4893809.1 hypothetical protein [Veillonella parvula]